MEKEYEIRCDVCGVDTHIIVEDGEDEEVGRELADDDRDHADVVGDLEPLQDAHRRRDEAEREDLGEHLDGEDVQVDPLAHVDERRLVRAARVERRLPRHRRAVADDGSQDDGVEGLRLGDVDGALARLVVRPQAEEGRAAVHLAARPVHRLGRIRQLQRTDGWQVLWVLLNRLARLVAA